MHALCGEKPKQQDFCATHQEVIGREGIVRAFEHRTAGLVPFSDEEIKTLECPRADELQIAEGRRRPSRASWRTPRWARRLVRRMVRHVRPHLA
jgi:hypothetical protein